MSPIPPRFLIYIRNSIKWIKNIIKSKPTAFVLWWEMTRCYVVPSCGSKTVQLTAHHMHSLPLDVIIDWLFFILGNVHYVDSLLACSSLLLQLLHAAILFALCTERCWLNGAVVGTEFPSALTAVLILILSQYECSWRCKSGYTCFYVLIHNNQSKQKGSQCHWIRK